MELAKLRVLFESAGFAQLSGQIGALQQKGEQGFAAIQHAATRSMGEITRNVGIGMTAVGASITGILGLAIKESAEAEEAQAQLAAVLKSTGGAAGLTAAALNEMASKLADTTTFTDDAVTSGQTMLLTFTNIGKETFPRATQAMLDMSVGMNNGKASAESLRGTSIQLGKALNDPIQGVTALQRSGVSLTATQEEQIKSFMALNDVASAQGIILGEVEKEFGGRAAAAANTLNGAIGNLKKQFGELLEAVGKALTHGQGLKSFVTSCADAVKGVAAWIEKNPELASGIIKAAAAVAAFQFVVGPLLITLVKLAPILTGLVGLFGGGAIAGAAGGVASGVAGAATAATTAVTGLGIGLGATAVVVGGVAIVATAAAVAIGADVIAAYKLHQANKQLAESEQRLQGQLDQYIVRLRNKGIVIDQNAMKEMNAEQRKEFVLAQENANEEGQLRFYLERLATKEAADAAFNAAKNLRVNENLSQEEAARVALLNIDNAAKLQIRDADAELTNALLVQLGIRTEQTAVAEAQKSQVVQEASDFDFFTRRESYRLTSETMDDYFKARHQTVSRLSQAERDAATETAINAEAMADSSKTAANAATAGQTLIQQAIHGSTDATRGFADAMKQLPNVVGTSADLAADRFDYAGNRMIQKAEDVRYAMEGLDMNVERSPSINQRIAWSLAGARRIFTTGLVEIVNIAGATREAVAAQLSASMPAFRVSSSAETARVLNHNLPASSPGLISKPAAEVPETMKQGSWGKGGVNITVNMGGVRETADVDKIITEISRKLALRFAMKGA